MRKILLLFSLLTFLSCGSKKAQPEKEVNVLFIGNSLTYYNEMPQMLQNMMDETNPNIRIDQITFPGMSLSSHLNNIIESESENNIKTRLKNPGETTETEKKIKEKAWDIIVLQTGGVSVLIPESVQYKVNPAIEEIRELVENKDARFVLFNTWTTKVDFPKKYCYKGIQIDSSLERMQDFCSPSIENSTKYLQVLNDSYRSIAKRHSLERTSHGTVFQKAFDEFPKIEILEDDMHPSQLGAFLSACIFYELLTNKSATELEYTADIEEEKAGILKDLAS